jgi:hypothetical protein
VAQTLESERIFLRQRSKEYKVRAQRQADEVNPSGTNYYDTAGMERAVWNVAGIDAQVYRLYGLTAEEIKMVEGASK